MAKKTRISLTVDDDVLSQLDDVVRKRQKEDLTKKRQLTNRSAVVEEFVRKQLERI